MPDRESSGRKADAPGAFGGCTPDRRESPGEREERVARALKGWEEAAPHVWTRTIETGFRPGFAAFDLSRMGINARGQISSSREMRGRLSEALEFFRRPPREGGAEGEGRAPEAEIPRGDRAVSAEAFSFFDLETSGLSGGSGTVAFLAAVGFIEAGEFFVTQVFLDDYPGEPDFLRIVLQLLSARPAVVSYNGMRFDLPLLKTRCILNAAAVPELRQLDILPISRRFWRRVRGSCSLANLEYAVLGISRGADIPGFLIPKVWLDFVAGRAAAAEGYDLGERGLSEAETISATASHNVQDVVSTARLFCHLLALIGTAMDKGEAPGADVVRVAEHIISLGLVEEGISLLENSAQGADSGAGLELSRIYHMLGLNAKRLGALAFSVDTFSVCVEKAKIYEHHVKDLYMAKKFAEMAGNALGRLLKGGGFDECRHKKLHAQLERRISRIDAKLEARGKRA